MCIDFDQKTNTFHELACDANLAYRKYRDSLLELFEGFKRTDPDLANHIIELFGNEERAAFFMGQENGSIGGTPYLSIATGKRDEVLNLLDGIEYWIKP